MKINCSKFLDIKIQDMRRQGARLTVSGALGRQSALDPLQTSGQTNSASLSKAEKENKVLLNGNFFLRCILSAW